MDIYVVSHDTFEDTNYFFTTREAAADKIERLLVKIPHEPRECWHIIPLREGKKFNGDLRI